MALTQRIVRINVIWYLIQQVSNQHETLVKRKANVCDVGLMLNQRLYRMCWLSEASCRLCGTLWTRHICTVDCTSIKVWQGISIPINVRFSNERLLCSWLRNLRAVPSQFLKWSRSLPESQLSNRASLEEVEKLVTQILPSIYNLKIGAHIRDWLNIIWD